jgi:hypothetical protein
MSAEGTKGKADKEQQCVVCSGKVDAADALALSCSAKHVMCGECSAMYADSVLSGGVETCRARERSGRRAGNFEGGGSRVLGQCFSERNSGMCVLAHASWFANASSTDDWRLENGRRRLSVPSQVFALPRFCPAGHVRAHLEPGAARDLLEPRGDDTAVSRRGSCQLHALPIL